MSSQYVDLYSCNHRAVQLSALFPTEKCPICHAGRYIQSSEVFQDGSFVGGLPQ